MSGTRYVLLARYDDGLLAEFAVSFLRHHGIEVRLQGNSGASSILNRFDTIIDIRLLVPEEQALQAKEALEAMTCGPEALVAEPPVSPDPSHAGSPYRMSQTTPHELTSDGTDEHKQRYLRAAFALAFALPIGSAHFYARHNVTGAILGLGIGAYFVTGALRGNYALVVAAMALVAFDALAGLLAVKRWNEGRVFSPRQQAGIAAVGLVAAMGAGLVLSSAPTAHEHPAGPHARWQR